MPTRGNMKSKVKKHKNKGAYGGGTGKTPPETFSHSGKKTLYGKMKAKSRATREARPKQGMKATLTNLRKKKK